MRRLIWTTLAAVTLIVAMPTAAGAATPFTAGSGERPAVAVGFDGSGHVVWATDSDEGAEVHYCRVSAGAESCNRTKAFDLSFGSMAEPELSGRALVFAPVPNKVIIVASCWNCPTGTQNRTYRWVSSDNGTSFGAGVQIGTGLGSTTHGAGAWLNGPGIFVAATDSHVRAANSAGEEGVEYATTGGTFVFSPQVVQLPGSEGLLAAVNDLEEVRYGVYEGPLSVSGINTLDSDWSIDGTLSDPEPDNSDTSLSAGPSGVFLAYRSGGTGEDPRLGLRRFDPESATFGPPSYVQGPDRIDDGLEEPDGFQDPTGRLHLVWRTLYDDGRLRYRTSADGTSFGPVGTLAAGEIPDEPEVAVNNGSGFAVWNLGFQGQVRVVPLDPRPESYPSEPESDPESDSPPPGVPPRPPRVAGARMGDRTLRPGQRTRFRFRSSEAGVAVLRIEKRFKGLKVRARRGHGGRRTVCRPPTKRLLRALRRGAGSRRAFRRVLRRRACHGYRRVDRIRRRVEPGVNTIPFNGRVSGRRLRRGAYRARLVVFDSTGRRSRVETIRFRVIRPKAGGRRGRR